MNYFVEAYLNQNEDRKVVYINLLYLSEFLELDAEHCLVTSISGNSYEINFSKDALIQTLLSLNSNNFHNVKNRRKKKLLGCNRAARKFYLQHIRHLKNTPDDYIG